jgi:hypothetical protein
MKCHVGILAAAIVLAATSVESHAQNGTGTVESHPQAGSVHLHVVSAGFIVSTGSGTGTLSYQGREYPLSVGNVSFGTIGVAGAELVGTVYNLRTVSDIAGTYTSVGAGLTVGAGAEAGRFRNANGVILELAGLQVGLAVGFGSAGMTITLQ